jgi:hypothetical protein
MLLSEDSSWEASKWTSASAWLQNNSELVEMQTATYETPEFFQTSSER